MTSLTAVQETDKAGIMRSDYERWFLTGFIAGVLATNPSMCMCVSNDSLCCVTHKHHSQQLGNLRTHILSSALRR